jgi:TPR repeat protein
MYRNHNPLNFKDFTKTVLEWDFDTLSKPLAIATSKRPLPKAVDNINEYYHNFLPFILEEARAIIANGLEQVNEYRRLQNNRRNAQQSNQSHLNDAQAFALRLKKQPNFPKTIGNPMSLHFSGKIPMNIEHGNSMNVLLLQTKGISPTKELIALVTEKPETSELFAKIIIDSKEYHEYQQCFSEHAKWEAHYLGSVVSEQRMYEACLEATDCGCVQQIARANIPIPYTHASHLRYSMDHLNLSQREAISAFLNAQKGTTLLLEGPPGTGKTTTLVTLLKEVTKQGTRTMVSAHSNKGVQVLALRAIEEMPDIPMILVGVASKLPETLQPIFLQGWYTMILSSFSSHYQKIVSLTEVSEIKSFKNSLISDIEQNIRMAEQALNKFKLIYTSELSEAQKEQLFAFCSDPLLAIDFKGCYANIAQLKLQPKSKDLWNTLLTTLNRCIGKWKSIQQESLEQYLVDHANIIFSTLISAGRKNMLSMAPIDYLLVDEAAQSVEAATLIPMRFRPSKILLVGDTKQLPATVISPVLDESDRQGYSTHYKWSMMWRLIQENKQPNLMLDIQYRMHPHICQWPSGQYYGNRLTTSPTILPRPTLDNTDITSRPYAIYQIFGQAKSSEGSKSTYNTQEAEYVAKIVEHIRRKNESSSIGVITPYAEQKRLITEKISQRKHLQESIDINTVDGFQGDERDIIIISFTRSHVSEFLKEIRRLNVAITRAKFCLIILAAPGLLSDDIGQLITDAKYRQVLYSERDLNYILQAGTTAAVTQSRVSTALWQMAWQGNPDAQLEYAKTLSDKSQAIIWYRRSAENNNAEAQYYCAQVYFAGNDFFKKDIQLGVAWLNHSTRQNFPPAQFLVARILDTGLLGIIDKRKAYYYYSLLANNGHSLAQYYCAILLESGIDIDRDLVTARHYYESCIEHCFEARLRLACLLLREIDRDLLEIQHIYHEQKNVNLPDHKEGQKTTEHYQKPIELLEHYFKHFPKEKSLVKSTEEYLESLVQNSRAKDSAYDIGVVNTRSEAANYLLGRIFQEGVGVIPNPNRALQYYLLATPHPDACYRAGYIYESGLGVAKNASYATAFYKHAAKQGHELASKRLTWSYWLSTKKDSVPNDETLKKTESRNCVMM